MVSFSGLFVATLKRKHPHTPTKPPPPNQQWPPGSPRLFTPSAVLGKSFLFLFPTVSRSRLPLSWSGTSFFCLGGAQIPTSQPASPTHDVWLSRVLFFFSTGPAEVPPRLTQCPTGPRLHLCLIRVISLGGKTTLLNQGFLPFLYFCVLVGPWTVVRFCFLSTPATSTQDSPQPLSTALCICLPPRAARRPSTPRRR